MLGIALSITLFEPGKLSAGQLDLHRLCVGRELLRRLATDQGKEIERLVQDIGHGDLGDGGTLGGREFLRTLQTLKIRLIAVGADAEPVEIAVETRQVVAGEPS